ncbi:MAG: hypothetical protein Fur0037_18380 [Planctomycetota bacterium]
MKSVALALCGVACWILAAALGGATADRVEEAGRAVVRPFALPFLWRSLDESIRGGSPEEAFAKGRKLMHWLGGWADGYLWIAWRWVDQASRAGGPQQALRDALTWLGQARARHPSVAVDLLVGCSWLVEMAARSDPGMVDLLASAGEGPARSAEEISDGFLAEAEKEGAPAWVRERRLFLVPRLLAVMLDRGESAGALALLDAAIERCSSIRDGDFAAEWRGVLRRLKGIVAGDRSADRADLIADPRLSPLRDFLERGR